MSTATEPGRLARGIATSTGGQLAAKAIHLVLNVVSSLVIIRYLVPAEYGHYILVLTVTLMLGLLADFGVDKVAVREIVADEDAEAEVLGAAVVARLGLAVVSAGLVQAVLAALGSSPEVRLAGAVMSLMFVTEALLTVVVVFHVRLQQQYDALVRVAAEAVETTTVVGVVLAGGTLVHLCAAPAVGGVAGVAAAVWLVRRRIGVRPRLAGSQLARIARAALPVGPAMIVGVLYLRVDSLMLAALRPSDEVGIYGGAFQPMEYLLLASAVLVNVLYPVLARLRTAEPDRYRLVYRRGTETLLAVMLPVPVVLAFHGEPLVELAYGADFAASAQPMRVLAVALVLLVMSAWHGFVLLAAHRQRVLLAYNLVGLLAAVALNLVLIPRFGYMGAATATLVTATVVGACAMTAAARLAGAVPEPGRLVRLAVAAGLLAAVLAALRAVGTPWWLALVVAVVAYPACLRTADVVTPADLRTAWADVRSTPAAPAGAPVREGPR